MLTLRLQLNHRFFEVCQGDRATIGVLRRDGTYKYYPWAGFIDHATAIEIGRPVKCRVSAFRPHGGKGWIDTDHLLGCLVHVGDSMEYRVCVVTKNAAPLTL